MPHVHLLLRLQVWVPLFTRLLQPVDDLVDLLRHRDLEHLLVVMEADLSDVHRGRLAQVGPGRIDDDHVVLLATHDGVLLHKLCTVLERSRRYVANASALGQPQVHVRRRQPVNVEPHVNRKPKPNEVLVFKLVLAHVNQPVVGALLAAPWPVVEDHGVCDADRPFALIYPLLVTMLAALALVLRSGVGDRCHTFTFAFGCSFSAVFTPAGSGNSVRGEEPPRRA
mmetsp:Transcript_24923/g.73710  ORF Transcript_24923/g.73710 Transcript_24923/m.73710 type:complete len:225 (-) Transcript_24923:68-742(-)